MFFFLQQNLKYVDYFYYDKLKKVIFDKNNLILGKSHILYKIINKYKIKQYLNNIKIINNTSIEEADNNLVYFGEDSSGKLQYIYGDDYVKKRINNKFINFIKIYNKIDTINNIINEGIISNCIDLKFIFSIILLFELTFFIRLGKKIYFDKKETIGVLTLQKSNIVMVKKNNIKISFKSKSEKLQEFNFNKDLQPILFDLLLKLKDQKNNCEFLFSDSTGKRFTEKMLNYRLKKLNINFKDLRTYGVNLTLIKNIYEKIKLIEFYDENKIQKQISLSINETATFIGHSINISKKSYIINTLINNIIIDKNSFNIIKTKSFEYFLKYIVNKIKKYEEEKNNL